MGGNYLAKAQSPQGWRTVNLRKQFERIINRAGLTKWPRLFHALRTSRINEWNREVPGFVVTAWAGNSAEVRDRHYNEVLESEFERAAGTAENNPPQNPPHYTPLQDDMSVTLSGAFEKYTGMARGDAQRAERTGFEPAER
ncbi:MAG: hypothetical protein R3C10_10795 [Pirellulales bacterium]